MASAGELTVSFFYIGHGDCILVQDEEHAILIDAGMAIQGDRVVELLKNAGVEKIDLLVLTHADPDHIGGMSAVIENFEIARCLEPGWPDTSRTYANFLRDLERKNVPVENPRAGDEYDLGEIHIEVLFPEMPFIEGAHSDGNANSVVFRIEFDEVSFLFTGDMELETEQRLLEAEANVRCDVLKVAHHGSRTSSSAEFLDATKAKYAVVSCETNSPLGHPRPEVVARILERDMEFYRTDVNGTVVCKTDGSSADSIEWKVERGDANDETVNQNPAERLRDMVTGGNSGSEEEQAQEDDQPEPSGSRLRGMFDRFRRGRQPRGTEGDQQQNQDGSQETQGEHPENPPND
ncbi:MAG: MBL fold metallo-hydrolase [Planctomycetes bacterium]|nr:MBL fold metallo-hydrolase [Planctomycetota bacterium]